MQPRTSLADLQAAPADTLRLRLGDAPLPLSRSIAALSSVRTLLELAARAAGLSSRVAAALLEQVTLGLAEPGNTSVRVLVPVSSGAAPSAELVSHAAEGGLGSPGRRVTEALTLLVARAQRAAQAAVTAKTLDPFVAEDVSAASCHALAAIGVPLALELGWALTLPRKAVPTVHFSPEQLAVLATAALPR